MSLFKIWESRSFKWAIEISKLDVKFIKLDNDLTLTVDISHIFADSFIILLTSFVLFYYSGSCSHKCTVAQFILRIWRGKHRHIAVTDWDDVYDALSWDNSIFLRCRSHYAHIPKTAQVHDYFVQDILHSIKFTSLVDKNAKQSRSRDSWEKNIPNGRAAVANATKLVLPYILRSHFNSSDLPWSESKQDMRYLWKIDIVSFTRRHKNYLPQIQHDDETYYKKLQIIYNK